MQFLQAQLALPSCLCRAEEIVRVTPETWHPNGRVLKMMGGMLLVVMVISRYVKALVEIHFPVGSHTSEQTW